MSLQAKAQKIAQFLPANKQIFLSCAQFDNTQQIPHSLKSKYFDDNIKEIAKAIAEQVFADKEASDIQQTDVILELQDWLTSNRVKFTLQKKEPKNQNPQRKPQLPQQRLAQDQPARRPNNQQLNLSPKPQRNQQPQQQHPVYNNPSAQGNHYTQPRPQTYYQTPPPQGRQTAVKYVHKQMQNNQPMLNQQAYVEQQMIKRQHYEKQNSSWIQNLSRCLTYPERRFYILPQMHPKRNF